MYVAGGLVIQISAIAFLLGCITTQYLSNLPSLWWAIVVIPVGLCSLRWRCFSPISFLLIGFFWSLFHASIILDKKLPTALEGRDVIVTGVVSTLPRYRSNSVRFILRSEKIESANSILSDPRKLRLTWYNSPNTIKFGERWRLKVRLKQPRGFQNPGTFDYEAWLFSQGINATGYIRADSKNEQLNNSAWLFSIGRYRSRLRDYINSTLADDQLRSIIVALAVGDRSQITEQQWSILRQTGTSHLIAISGLHVGLVATVLFFVGSFLWRLPGRTVLWLPAPKAGALSALLGGLGYAALAGFSMPTQRALIMLGALLVGVLFQRRSALSYRLALALLLVLLFDPLAVMAAGFWLSFAAVGVIGLVVFGSDLNSKSANLSRSSSLWRGFYRWTSLQWAIGIGLIPTLLLWFQQFSIISPLANLLAIPVIGLVVVPMTLLSLLAFTLSLEAVAEFGLHGALWLLDICWSALEALSSVEWLVWWQHQPPIWTLLLAFVGVAWILLPKGFPNRWLGFFWLAPIFLIAPPAPKAGELWVTVLDVGQGLSVVARSKNHLLVYDTGARFSSSFSVGSGILAPYLRSIGISKIDTLVISHGDNDHIGGINGLLQSLPVQRIFTSVPEKIPQGEHCLAGQSWVSEQIRYRFLNPISPLETGNNSSCVLQITSSNGTILLTGDIEADTEQRLVDRLPTSLHAQVLLVAHHGSRTSSTPEFLSAVKPELAVASYGYRNRYRHPHPMVLKNYERANIPFIGTPEAGAITIRIGSDEIQVDRHRKLHKRYWMAQ